MEDFVIQNDVLEQYRGERTQVEIPEGIAAIGEGAFRGNSSLVRVTVPEGVRWIGQEAFRECARLEEIVLPSSLEQIGESAFQECRRLERLLLPVSLKKICRQAFEGCVSLERLFLGQSVSVIEAKAFASCIGLQDISVDPDNPAFAAQGPLLLNREKNRVCLAPGASGSLELPQRVEHISEYAFAGNRLLSEIRLPENLLTMGEGAFSGCEGLRSVVMPRMLRTVAERVFSGCSALEEITVHAPVFAIQTHAFQGCTAMQTVRLPETIRSICYCAFSRCPQIREVTLSARDMETPGSWGFLSDASPNGPPEFVFHAPELRLDQIDGRLDRQAVLGFAEDWLAGYPFRDEVLDSYRRYLRSQKDRFLRDVPVLRFLVEDGIIPPNDLEDLRKKCSGSREAEAVVEEYLARFAQEEVLGCTDGSGNLSRFWKTRKNKGHKDGTLELSGYTGVRRDVILPAFMNGVRITAVAHHLFSQDSNIVSATISEGIVAIGDRAFSSCPNLEKICLPASMKKIQKGALRANPKLREITVAKKNPSYRVTEEGMLLKIRSRTLVCAPPARMAGKVTVPAGMKRLDFRALAFCRDMTEVSLPDTLEYIGDEAFQKCVKLTEVEIPAGVSSIGENAFRGCAELTRVSIPETVKKIGSRAFSGCPLLREIRDGSGIVEREWDRVGPYLQKRPEVPGGDRERSGG